MNERRLEHIERTLDTIRVILEDMQPMLLDIYLETCRGSRTGFHEVDWNEEDDFEEY